MSKTQLLSVTKTFVLQGKIHSYLIQKWLLDTVQIQGQVTPKSDNRKFFCSFIFGDTSHISTIQNVKSKIRMHI
jgi:hypothetical protein